MDHCESDDIRDDFVVSYLHVAAACCGGYWDWNDREEVPSTLRLESTHDLFGDLFDDEEKR